LADADRSTITTVMSGVLLTGSFGILWFGHSALAALIVGVIANIHLVFRSMTLFELLTILVLTLGGVGLFLRSLRHHGPKETKAAE